MGGPNQHDHVRIRGIRKTRETGASRVTADVDGRAVWFESCELELEPVAEGFASAFLIPALHHRAALDLDVPLDPVWAGNVPAILELLRDWWSLPGLPPRAPSGQVRDHPEGGGRALFFSGGVDSFFSLLRVGLPMDRLLLIHGFDYGLEERCRLEAAERTLRAVAGERGLEWAVVRTNARSHPLFDDVSWERAHGGVLAAVGHLLGNEASELYVSSSVPQVTPIPWGSHWLLDPLWSSAAKRFVHVGHDHRKEDKLRAIADEPLAHDHLRVCWENRSASGNCSRCYKCLYARLVLAEIGALDRFRVFEGVDTLASGFDALPRGKDRMRTFTSLMDSPRLPADVKRALADLVERTKRQQRPLVRMRRAVLARVLGWMSRRQAS